jgi:hypothetical protein
MNINHIACARGNKIASGDKKHLRLVIDMDARHHDATLCRLALTIPRFGLPCLFALVE